MIVKGGGKRLGLTQQRQDASKVIGHRTERRAEREPEVDGLLARVVRLRQMRKDAERLLEVSYGFAVG